MGEVENKKEQNAKTSRVAVITVFASVAIIPFLVLSAYRVAVKPCLSDGFTYPLGLSAQTYAKLGRLCNILPIIPFVFGIVALIQIALSHRKLRGKKWAILGMVLAVVSAVSYWLCLVILLFLHWPS